MKIFILSLKLAKVLIVCFNWHPNFIWVVELLIAFIDYYYDVKDSSSKQ